MIRLAPSILSADFSKLGEEIRTIEEAGAHLLHIDVMDGNFVPNISFGPVVLKSIVGKTALPFDVHLMISEPDRYIADFVTEQTEYITVHAEACIHLHRTIQLIKSFGIKAGVSLNPATPLSVLDYVVQDLDQVLIMSVNPGFGGQAFIPSALDKLRYFQKVKETKNNDLTIGVDGGITLSNVKQVVDAGANLIVAGSAIFGAKDVGNRVKQFIDLL
jgi:ribulose-phosphate 3-epimerase